MCGEHASRRKADDAIRQILQTGAPVMAPSVGRARFDHLPHGLDQIRITKMFVALCEQFRMGPVSKRVNTPLPNAPGLAHLLAHLLAELSGP